MGACNLVNVGYLLTPNAVSESFAITGIGEVSVADSNYTAAGTATAIGEGVISATGGEAVGSPAALIGEGVVTATPNKIYSGGSALAEGSVTTGIGGGSGAAIAVYDEGVLVTNTADCLNFIGADIQAQSGATCTVDIYSPPPSYVSHWDTVDGTTTASVVDITTSNRYISSPSGGEGTPFYTGGGVAWGGDGSTHPATRTSPLVWTPGGAAANLVLFDDLTTTFTITFTDSSGTIETYTTPVITGAVVLVSGNITVNISNWAANADKYQANVSISVDIATMLPNSGYFDVLLRHSSGGTDYDYTQ